MKVVCIGGPFHQLAVELPSEQVSFCPTGEARPCYVRRLQSPDKTRAYFALRELSELEANQLVMEHLRSRSLANVWPSHVAPAATGGPA